ncbi:13707_t:CDS:1, partial [Dentiscutata erythropus]
MSKKTSPKLSYENTEVTVFSNQDYPDNVNRIKRVNKLEVDIKSYNNKIVQKNEKLDLTVKNLMSKLNIIADKINFTTLKAEEKVLIYEIENYFVYSKIIEWIFNISLNSVKHAYLFSLKKKQNLNISFTEFRFDLNWTARIFDIAIDQNIKLERFINDAVTGADKRRLLQEFIKEFQDP